MHIITKIQKMPSAVKVAMLVMLDVIVVKPKLHDIFSLGIINKINAIINAAIKIAIPYDGLLLCFTSISSFMLS